MAGRLLPLTTRQIGLSALFSAILLGLLTASLAIVRNSVENDLVQRAAMDIPVLKNRWPQFKDAVEELHQPIVELLSSAEPLKITSPLTEIARKITEEHTYSLLGGEELQGKIIANIEIILFEKGVQRPAAWHWSPEVDTSLRALETRTRVSLQQIEQTQLLTVTGLHPDPLNPATLSSERRALVFLYLHTQWNHREVLINLILRAAQISALTAVFAMALWVYLTTRKKLFPVLIVLTAVVGLVVYSSFALKALSLRTVLSMMITVQYGASANRAADYAGLSLLGGALYGLVLIGLMHLPASPACPECKNFVSEGYRFCPHCNLSLRRNCSRCSAPVDPRWNYCPNCSEDI